jgi:hypothetical protein
MPDKPTEAPTEKEENAEVASSSDSEKRARPIFRVILLVCILAVAAFLAQGFGLVPTIIPLGKKPLDAVKNLPLIGRLAGGGSPGAQMEPGRVFKAGPGGELLSQGTLLAIVGKGPVDPSSVLFPTFEESLKPGGPKTNLKTCPPGAKAPEVPKTGKKEAEPVKEAVASHSPRLVETPIVESRGPEKKAAKKASKAEEKVASREKAAEKDRPGKRKGSVGPGMVGAGKSTETSSKSDVATLVSKRRTTGDEEDAVSGKPENYRLPGALRINVSNYKGTRIKWGLMVILDDSSSMGRKFKPWKPNRMQAAREFLAKMRKALTPGSRIAVRDFYCSKSKRKRKRGRPLCLSHKLYPWSGSPFTGLDAKLKDTEAFGRTNPCAAAAFAVKTDLKGLGGLTPRTLVVTNGLRKCAYREVLRVIDRKHGKGKVRVDVVALGMSRRRQRGYARLAAKTGGVFLKLAKPSDVSKALSKYGEILKTPALKKMEVRGGKTDLRVGNGEEVTLAPGSYTIVLPPIPGLKAANRTIKDIKISSGENKILMVKIRKGRLIVKSKKP